MSDPKEKSESEHLPRAQDGIYAAAARSLTQAAAAYYRNPMRVFRPQSMEVKNTYRNHQTLSLIKTRGSTQTASQSTMKALKSVIKEDGVLSL